MSENNLKGHDHFFKQSMSRPYVAKDFFETHLPEEVREFADLSTLEIVNTNFIDSALGEGIVDLLYSVQIQGKLGYLILCEHQSTQDKLITFRILKYAIQIWGNHIAKKPGTKLPLIYPLIVYSGKAKYTAPLSFWELFEIPELAKEFITKPLQLIEVSQIPEEVIFKQQFAGLMTYIFQKIHEPDIIPYLKKAADLLAFISEKDFLYLTDMLKYIISKGETKSRNPEDVVLLIKDIVPKEKRGEIMTIAEQLIEKGIEKGKIFGIKEGIEKGKIFGIQEGIEKGKIEGKIEIAKKMLDKGQSIALIAEITGLSIREIESLSH